MKKITLNIKRIKLNPIVTQKETEGILIKNYACENIQVEKFVYHTKLEGMHKLFDDFLQAVIYSCFVLILVTGMYTVGINLFKILF